MDNATILFKLTKELYPINKDYYNAALQVTISMSIVLIPNLYFLYVVLTESIFSKRPILKNTILTFCFLNISNIIANLIITSNYLYSYNNGEVIIPGVCALMRRASAIPLMLLITTPLIFTVQRYFTVFSKNDFQNYIAFTIFIVVNFPNIILIASMFDNTNIIWMADEVCTYSCAPTLPFFITTLSSIYYISLVVPIIVLIINCYMIKRLSSLSVTSSVAKHKKKENRIVFINLLIQTLQPFVGQWPTILFSFYLQESHNLVYVVWRILDGLTAISHITNIFFSVIFIKDIRNVFLKKFGIKVTHSVGDITTITNNALQKRKSHAIIV
uniref:G_PROTEIN_RECEP_F1_2 domain-containing protein n=1 Tax=Parastrongyloides trichosuri TaxID=131310 RepID=A0A0N5A159_PARTI